MIVIGLTGKAGAGKSTVADHLVEAHGFTKLSFAGPLKKMLRTLDPIVDHQHVWDGFEECMTGPLRMSNLPDNEADLKEYYPEYRRLLQALGTDCIRAVDEDFWVVAAMRQITDPDGKYVFDDVRFPNEASAVYLAARGTDFGPAVWHIDRPNYDGGAGAHESEEYAGKMGETLTITNAGSRNDMLAHVNLHMERLAQEAAA